MEAALGTDWRRLKEHVVAAFAKNARRGRGGGGPGGRERPVLLDLCARLKPRLRAPGSHTRNRGPVGGLLRRCARRRRYITNVRVFFTQRVCV